MGQRLTPDEHRQYRQRGFVETCAILPEHQLDAVRTLVRALAPRPPWQEMLSGVHNPFGHHACIVQAWSLLDVGECPALLDIVEDVIGADIILWDSELFLDGPALTSDEPRYWPVDPLAGAIVSVVIENGRVVLADVTRSADVYEATSATGGAQYILRYIPATSHFNRDPQCPANQYAAEARVLVNYATRPIWLVRGQDHGDNDFATGFSLPAARWAGAPGESREKPSVAAGG
jgi:hypothetical protein